MQRNRIIGWPAGWLLVGRSIGWLVGWLSGRHVATPGRAAKYDSTVLVTFLCQSLRFTVPSVRVAYGGMLFEVAEEAEEDYLSTTHASGVIWHLV